MKELDKKICDLFRIIYDLDEKEINDLLKTIKDLSDKEKKSTISALYSRYKSVIDNSKYLTDKLQSIKNNTDEDLEKINTKDINLNF